MREREGERERFKIYNIGYFTLCNGKAEKLLAFIDDENVYNM